MPKYVMGGGMPKRYVPLGGYDLNHVLGGYV